MRVTHTAWFNCSPHHLWTFIEDPEKQKLWMKGLVDNQSTSPPPVRPGSTFHLRIKEGRYINDYDGEIVAREAPNFLSIRFWGGSFSPGMIMSVDYRLSEENGGTRLDYESRVEGKRPGFFLWLLLSTIVRLFGKMHLKSFLKRLKELAEAPSEPTPAQAG